jgi:hypothetical protein
MALLLLAPAMMQANRPDSQATQALQSDYKAQEFTKTIKKEFSISSSGTVNLINKYGKIEVKTWDKSRAKIDVTIVVKASSESDAQRVFDRIQIDFSNDDNFVKAETIIESAKSSWWSWGSNNSEFQINYEVFMPQSGSLDLSNKYGDSFVAPIGGKANVEVKYGNFRLEGVGGDLNVSLGYGSGTVVKAKNINADISYSKASFNDVGNTSLTTSYSKITMDNGADLKVDSRYDQFNLTKVNRFDVQSRYGNFDIGSAEGIAAVSRYTDYKVGRLTDKGDFDLQYGGLRIDRLAKGFSNINLLGKYSDFKIGVEEGASYVLDAASNYAGISYPEGLNVTFEKDKGSSHEVKGHKGTQNARSIIKANLSYGGLKVMQ